MGIIRKAQSNDEGENFLSVGENHKKDSTYLTKPGNNVDEEKQR